MTRRVGRSRRRVVAAVGFVAVGPLAGCADTDSSTASETSTDADSSTPDDAASTEADDLDLREANVTDVTVTDDGEDVEFSVELYHDDDGEDGYADWWQIERRDGTRLGRRDLAHANSTAPFTRSETVDVPGDVDCVVVRGHDRTHGYGGRAMLVTLDSGATQAVDQGSEPDSFEGVDCP
ncbi:hypothetical protein [Halohasta salina]|uniref:hypothetical protein n=1 Tax=Halohasta salina TaxID=2961621 RepID=UPI0020A27035|nr:hypothetical protein [Halohasta salina]